MTMVWKTVTLIFSVLGVWTLAQDTDSCDYKTFTQVVDHFGNDNGTFAQRYSFFDEHYKPGGPIFLYQGEEGAADCANTTSLYYFAERTGGLAVSLEHRYFGESQPFSTQNASWTNASLRYLTLDNVMEDSVTFVEMLKRTVPCARDSKVVTASGKSTFPFLYRTKLTSLVVGSYGGTLATAFRQNRPDTFFGAIAAAPVVKSFGNSSDPATFYWWDYVTRTYLDRSLEAANKIKVAFTTLKQRLQSGGDYAKIQSELGLCETPTNSTAMTLLRSLVNVFTIGIQYNYAKARPGRGPGLAYPFDKIINLTLEAEAPINVINDTNWYWYGAFSNAPRCISLQQNFSNTYLAAGIQTVPFHYITCAYLPLQENFGPDTIFGFSMNYSDTYSQSCLKNYQRVPLTQEQISDRYRLHPAQLYNSTNIIFSEAQYDPTTSIGPDYMPVRGGYCGSRYLYVNDMAHREELYYPDPSDKPSVVEARNTELEIIKGWLEYCD